MRLLSTYQDDLHFYIVTDEGERKIVLRWKGIGHVRKKCQALIGKEIETSVWGDWDGSEWFNDLREVRGSESRASKLTILKNLPKNEQSFERQSVIRILGPPGTGKTTRLISLVKEGIENGTKPEDIAFLSFSNEAANVAKERVCEAILDRTLDDFSHFRTLHSMATKLGDFSGYKLSEEDDLKSFDKGIECEQVWLSSGKPDLGFRYKHPILDRLSLANNCLEEMSHELPSDYWEREKSKKALQSYFDLRDPIRDEQYEHYSRGYVEAFLRFKNNNQIIVFDDVIEWIVSDKLSDENIPSFELLIIDEAQDLTPLLWKFADRLVSKAKDSYIAGDDDQAIWESLGEAPGIFVSKGTNQEDIFLDQSYRVPQTIKKFLDEKIIMLLDKKYPDRIQKEWKPRDKIGEVITTNEQNRPFTFLNLKDEIIREAESEWLVMAPTRETSKLFSKHLEEENIPHFFRNKPMLGAHRKEAKIRVQTIHISKGAEADNVALLIKSQADRKMLSDDPKLKYVAVSRVKEKLFILNPPTQPG